MRMAAFWRCVRKSAGRDFDELEHVANNVVVWRLLAHPATAAGNRSVSAIDRPLDTAVPYGVLDFFIP